MLALEKGFSTIGDDLFRALGVELPGSLSAATTVSADLSELVPAELRADLVMRVPGRERPDQTAALVILEVQLPGIPTSSCRGRSTSPTSAAGTADAPFISWS